MDVLSTVLVAVLYTGMYIDVYLSQLPAGGYPDVL